MTIENIVKVSGIISLVIFLTVYFFLNRNIKEAKLIHINVDDKIPFLAWSIVPYLLFYVPLLYGSIFLSYLQPLDNFYPFVFSLFLVLFESFSIFIVFPTKVKEFEVVGNSIWDRWVRLLYRHDKRVTAFPSIHVGVSIVSSFYFAQWYPFLSVFFLFVALSIILSTVTTKQHSLLDIFGGLVAGINSVWIGKLLFIGFASYLWI